MTMPERPAYTRSEESLLLSRYRPYRSVYARLDRQELDACAREDHQLAQDGMLTMLRHAPSSEHPCPECFIDHDLVEIEVSALADIEPVTIMHRFWLRKHYRVTVPLPADLGQHEAERLAQWILTLPYTPENNGE